MKKNLNQPCVATTHFLNTSTYIHYKAFNLTGQLQPADGLKWAWLYPIDNTSWHENYQGKHFEWYRIQQGKKGPSIVSHSTCNVAQGPNGLFADVLMGWCHQADESWNGSSNYDGSSLVWSTWGNVSQGPSCLKLDGGAVRQRQKTNKRWDESGSNDAVIRWVFFSGKEPSVNQKKNTVGSLLKVNYVKR